MRSTLLYNMTMTPNQEALDRVRLLGYSVTSSLVVFVGIVGNLLSLLVLCSSRLRGVMYMYLAALTTSNLCVLLFTLPLILDISKLFKRGNLVFALYQAHFKIPIINSFMASSVYIIIIMTVNRFISIHKPMLFKSIHTNRNAKITTACAFLLGFVIHIPLCLQHKIVCISKKKDSSTCLWFVSDNNSVSNSGLFLVYLFVSELFLRFGPIVILAVLNCLIIYKVNKLAKQRQANLKGIPQEPLSATSSLPHTPSPKPHTHSRKHSNVKFSGKMLKLPLKKKTQHYRRSSTTSKLSQQLPLESADERRLIFVLIALVILFVFCTTPAAFLSLISSPSIVNNLNFQIFCAVANNLELMNFALNFYVYCLCCSDIRRAFKDLFNRWAGVQRTIQSGDVI